LQLFDVDPVNDSAANGVFNVRAPGLRMKGQAANEQCAAMERDDVQCRHRIFLRSLPGKGLTTLSLIFENFTPERKKL
jgi:hypothetical protein